MRISDDILYVGVNDHQVDLFEGQYPVKNGMSYNSYVILDEKTAVMDAVDIHFGDEWLRNVEQALAGRKPDYLVVHHMEPDHSANMARFLEKYPEAQVVASARAFPVMKQFFGSDYADRRIVAGEGTTLSLGKHTLTFVAAPMVHWPEVIVSYDSCDHVLFSADGFGKFGALDVEEEWDNEARRYYIGIVGKFGPQVQNLLKKASALDIRMICPLHGPVLKENLGHYIGLYDTWSSYRPESQGVTVAYASIYGNTARAARALAEKLEARGVKVSVFDLARDDMSEAVENAFRYDRLVLACTTYNGSIFPFMHDYLIRLVEHNFRNRKVAFVENGSWGPVAAKNMAAILEPCKELTFAEHTVTIRSAPNAATFAQLDELADELAQEV